MKDATYDASQRSVPVRVALPSAMTGPPAGFSLSDGWDLSGITLTELWLRYLAVGGTASPGQVAAYARGQSRPDSHEHNMIAQAINEHFMDQGEDHPVSYQDILPPA